MNFDILIIGAGPAGMAFACGLANSKVKVAIIDKLPKKIFSDPKIDGREIALTHHSADILNELGVWKLIPKKLISVIGVSNCSNSIFSFDIRVESDTNTFVLSMDAFQT